MLENGWAALLTHQGRPVCGATFDVCGVDHARLQVCCVDTAGTIAAHKVQHQYTQHFLLPTRHAFFFFLGVCMCKSIVR